MIDPKIHHAAIDELKRLVEERVARGEPTTESGRKFVEAVRALPGDERPFLSLSPEMRAKIQRMVIQLETKLLADDVINLIDEKFPGPRP